MARQITAGIIHPVTLFDTAGNPTGATINLSDSEAFVGIMGGSTILSIASFTRPADTSAYAISDAVSNSTTTPTVLTFQDAARVAGGSGYVTKVRLMTTQSTNTAQFRLHLFNAAVTAVNDNSPYTLLWANRQNRIGAVDLPSCNTEGAGSDAANALNSIIRLAFDAGTNTRHLYGLLETKTAFTPASGQQFFIEIATENN